MYLNQNRISGLSLCEIVIVLFLISTVFLFAVPPFRAALIRHQTRNVMAQFMADLHFAKTYANRYKTRVTFCNLNEQKQCNKTNNHNWSYGWHLYEDSASAFDFLPDKKIRERYFSSSAIQITSSSNIKGGLHLKPFRQVGTAFGTGLPNGHFKLCPEGQSGYKIIVNIFGYSRSEKLTQSCFSDT